jgi:hypothetical protein
MTLSEKGWFKNLISSQAVSPEQKIEDKNEYLYKTTHSSGLIYGHPVLPKEYKNPKFLELSPSDKLKLVVLDGFIKTAIFPSNEIIPNDPDEFVHFLSESIIEYYSNVVPNKKIKDRNFWGKKLSNEEIVESLLNDRLASNTDEPANFWISFFNNSLLFLDVFFFGEWLTNRHEEASVQKIQKHRDQIHLLLLQVMASAAYADNTLQEEEKVLFNQFLASTHLPENMEKEAASYINTGVILEDIDVSAAKTWILRKYILELAILTIWADQIVTEEEKQFIGKLSDQLGFTRDELEISMVAIESFVLTNWGNIPFLQSKNSFDEIRSRFVERMSKVMNKNKTMIGTEIKESKELMDLLIKSTQTDLSEEEQIKVRAQLIDILKMLPTFVIIALPGSFLTLPLLLKILPKSTLPSAFGE